MIKIEEHVSLRAFNTFGIEAKARYFCAISSEDQFIDLLNTPEFKNEPHLILGGGSNILFTKDYEGLVIKVNLKGIEVTNRIADTLSVTAKSGEVWHEFVMHCVQEQWGGIENLSLIPGTIGAAPIQNIGAYGVEIKDVVERVDGIDLKTGKRKTFTNTECNFGYRESIFKHELKEKFFISSVTLTLTTDNHKLNTSYGAISSILDTNKKSPSIKTISEAVINIRRSKLPDPLIIGNAGSFFKNPTIPLEHYNELKKTYPTITGYPSVNQYVKVPAGWLIEQCNWKGKRFNNVGVHANQALVLVNYGNASGEEIFQLAKKISASVNATFNIELTPEVNII
ncbi:MAG: UDP-N-acetylmuramate dehydrogenase [Cyclobacteriaceae bacterium]|jgi:UDP-N-acetylmuramate dehydrogenase|nr:UDP-N-acetylmuramate dehydrogenase [Cyclobacteriaceae bacterium]